ncbi:MAG: TOBE domain-containing protein, partial [Solirubrobacteraceae bacterium]
EPFSALGAPVRAQLRRELRRLQRDANLSTVLVTHDPEEAAMLAEEILVVSDGRVLQSGRCRDVYRRPASVEIGRLLGIDNLFEGVAGADGALLAGGNGAADASGRGIPVARAGDLPAGADVLWQVPPEAVRVVPQPAPSANVSTVDLGRGRVTDIVDLGRTVELVVELAAGGELRARALDAPDLAVGASCRLEADVQAVSLWRKPADPGAGVDTAALV